MSQCRGGSGIGFFREFISKSLKSEDLKFPYIFWIRIDNQGFKNFRWSFYIFSAGPWTYLGPFYLKIAPYVNNLSASDIPDMWKSSRNIRRDRLFVIATIEDFKYSTIKNISV